MVELIKVNFKTMGTKRLTLQEKQEKAFIDIINKMFEIAGHSVTFEDIKGRQDNWYQEWTMTMEQNKEWIAWGKQYLMRNLRMYAKTAEREMQWMSVSYGLKFRDFKV